MFSCLLITQETRAGSGIDSVTTSTNAIGSTLDYVAPRAPDGDPAAVGDTNALNFASGGGIVNTVVDDITIGATTLDNLTTSDATFFRRNAVTLPTEPDRQMIWYDATRTGTVASYTFDIPGGRAFSMTEALTGNVATWGTDNVFDNTQSNKNNIERIDFVYTGGIQPQNAAQLSVGFSVIERGGNDDFKIAAITGIDGFGNPTSYGTLTTSSGEWGAGLLAVNTVIVRGQNTSPYDFEPSGFVEGQSIAGVFLSLGDLGVGILDTIYGYSLFGADTTGSDADLLDWNDAGFFPTDTTDPNGGLDLISGGILWTPDTLDTTGLLIPEPSSVVLLMTAGWLAIGRRRRRPSTERCGRS